MQKIKTHEYEFLARLLSPEPLYEFRWKDRVIITTIKDFRDMLDMYYRNRDWRDIEKMYDPVITAHTSRSAWRKLCRNLSK
jgi:hypothetical protein